MTSEDISTLPTQLRLVKLQGKREVRAVISDAQRMACKLRAEKRSVIFGAQCGVCKARRRTVIGSN
jgi:hypothetical protein